MQVVTVSRAFLAPPPYLATDSTSKPDIRASFAQEKEYFYCIFVILETINLFVEVDDAHYLVFISEEIKRFIVHK